MDLDTLQSELDAIIDDLPAACEWKGKTFAGCKGELGNAVEVTTFAFEGEADLILSAPRNVFALGALPRIQDRIKVDGAPYEIATIAESRDGLVIRYGLKKDDRRVP